MAKRTTDASVLENWIKYGVDLAHRRVDFGYIDGYTEDGHPNEFWEATINVAVRSIRKMLDISNAPIEIHMSSWGGSPHDMLALYDLIHEAPCKFIFYGRGKIMSAATWIMCSCDERYVSKNTRIMIHDGWDGDSGKATDFEIYGDEGKEFQNRLNELYAENSYMDKKFWETFVRRDLYLWPEEAMKLGLIDGIVPYKKRGNFRKGPRSTTFNNPPSKSVLTRLSKKLANRIKLPGNLDININITKEEFEDIESYDNSDLELKNLNEELRKNEKDPNKSE
jgi:ATP-dependent protease ClpP protease subunit